MISLIRLLAARTASQLNQSEISRTIQLPNATLGRYMELLEKVFLIHFIMVDCGLATHLIGADAARLAKTPELAGQLVETFVVNELLKHLTWSSIAATPYHFRTHTGLKVDLILEKPSGEIACVEIKSSSQLTSKDFGGLQSLQSDIGEKFITGVVFYGGKEIVPFGNNLFAVPVSALWI